MVEPERSLKSDPSRGVLVLDEDRVPRPQPIVHPWRYRFSEPVRDAVVELIREILAVRVPRPDVAQVSALVSDLEALPSGHIRRGRAPTVRAGVVLAPVLRSVHQTWDPAVRRAARGTLFDDIDQIVRRIWITLEIAPRVIDPAPAGIEEQLVRQGRRPGHLRYAERFRLAHAAGFRRDARRIGDTRRETRARAAVCLLVPENAHLIARADLPRDASTGVLRRPIVVSRTAQIGRVQPLGRVARVLVVVHVGDDFCAALRACVQEVPDSVPLDRTAERPVQVVHLRERRRGREPGSP